MSDPVKLIEPRTLRGFRDYLPELMIPREWMLEQARRVYRSYGFAPIDTPALEYAEILLGKGGAESDKLIYRFCDHGDRDVALRFDLTVPFARFAAQHIAKLGTPFKRYHMGPVWRGENTGQGRYREFWQCDFDSIGTTSNAADIEVALVIHDLLVALNLDKFRICINNRLLLNGVLDQFGMTDKAVPILHVLDKLAKIKRDATRQEMIEHAGITTEQANKVLDLAETEGTNTEKLDQLEKKFAASAHSAEGIKRLRQLLEATAKAGMPQERILIDLSICRGLDYYTGTVYETFLTDMPDYGSVCSGGRYDNLAGLYTKQSLPGVGASLGLDRLLAALEELKLLKSSTTPASVFIVQFSADRVGEYQRMARVLRAADIGAEVFPDAKKIGQQLQYAEKRGFKLALIAGPDDFARGTWNVKDLAKREEKKGVPDAEVPALVQSMLTVYV
jgi:histidyl-tRNA synthetase